LRLVPGSIPQAVLKELDHEEYLRREKTRSYIRMADRSVVTHTVKTHFPLRGASYDDIHANYREKTPPAPPVSHIDWYIETAKRYRENGYATTFWVSSGIFEAGCWVRGYDDMCVDMLINEDIAKLIFERIMEARLEWVNTIVPPLAEYVDIFCFGDDLAIQTGPFMSPDIYRNMIMPFQAPIYSQMAALAPKSHIFHHSCGSIYKLIPLLKEMGVSVLNPTQISAVDMSPEKLKGYGGVCYHGGIDLQDVLPHYTPDAVKKETERVMSILSPGYICAACHSLPEDVPVENILAMFSANRNQNPNL
jgi:uroporphyrinogen decarboxylase